MHHTGFDGEPASTALMANSFNDFDRRRTTAPYCSRPLNRRRVFGEEDEATK
ncbi:hypothetical protein A2U01_0115962 [Trifolium medium]|uniref:Uncharacterized protein n=1 Tax=Trifolium medium TaxID=97028 RepID=A0A392W1X2_9FABA|nr:hypothetical protein [Trifolium medium]